MLLTSHLGDPARKPLTVPQFRELTRRGRAMEAPKQERELTREDLLRIGCSSEFADRVLHLLSQKEQLDWYLQTGKKRACLPITRLSDHYPDSVRKGLAMEAPGCLWAKGNVELLSLPRIALVGSRELRPENRAFAREVGYQAARQGYCLVSGNAKGADREAQEACLAHGGYVICVVADALENAKSRENVLYLSEEGFDLVFSPQRALSRNRVIHCLGQKTFVAQSTQGKGGTWAGTSYNLFHSLSPVFCFGDESPATAELIDMGAVEVDMQSLQDISALLPDTLNMLLEIDQ